VNAAVEVPVRRGGPVGGADELGVRVGQFTDRGGDAGGVRSAEGVRREDAGVRRGFPQPGEVGAGGRRELGRAVGRGAGGEKTS